MKGKVKFYNEAKRFGFIVGEDDTEYFVHESGLSEGLRLREDDEVNFEIEQSDRGPKAISVTKNENNEPEAE